MYATRKIIKKGDTIGVVSPASPCERTLLENSQQALCRLGYKVKLAKNSFSYSGYLAGEDQERAEAFMKLWLDPEVDIIWCSRGGYGSARILSYLDFEKLKQHSKVFIGMSDITALHIALIQEIETITYLGPTIACLADEGWGYALLQDIEQWSEYFSKGDFKYLGQDFTVIREGYGKGPLVGGNLSLIVSLIGTRWQLRTQGTILVLEDVNEPPYKIDRMLNQLQLSGCLDSLAGVILGRFEGCQPAKNKASLELLQVFNFYFSTKKYPSFFGFPVGHFKGQKMLPLGCLAEMSAFVNGDRFLYLPCL